VALPRSRAIAVAPGLVLGLVWKVIMALPEAYGEAIQMLSRHHGRERLAIVPGSGSRSSLVVFLEVFLITLTPLTIALAGFRWLVPGSPARERESVIGVLVSAMVLALLLPVLMTCRTTDLWHRLAAFASISTKMAILLLGVLGVPRRLDDRRGRRDRAQRRQCRGDAARQPAAGGGGLITLPTLVTLISDLLLLFGLVFWLWGTWPLLGRASYLAKLHSLSISDTLGSALIVVGLLLKLPREWPLLSLALLSLVVWNTLFGYVLAVCSLSRPATGRPE